MKVKRMASVPLILQDPYVSIWSPCDKLYGGSTVHWSGNKLGVRGILTIDGKQYCFMGQKGEFSAMVQTGLELTATTTTYYFEKKGVHLKVEFISPMLLDDPILVSRPCTYVDFEVSGDVDGKDISVTLAASEQLVTNTKAKVLHGAHTVSGCKYIYMNSVSPVPLSQSGDNITIDWGVCYLAGKAEQTETSVNGRIGKILATVDLNQKRSGFLVFAFDDIQSIQYFSEAKKGYWTTKYKDIIEAILASIEEHDTLKVRCQEFDEKLEKAAYEIGGEDYAFLCNASYRHSIAAHKLIADNDGNLIFLSKENDSNGCIGTVDVSYPSVPLYLLYNPEYVRGMMRPIFEFAACDVWEYDFAPHDVGRYPHAVGQVYGVNWEAHKEEFTREEPKIYPYFYMFPKGTDCYDLRYQMPVEECGNMLIMAAAVTLADGKCDFVRPYMQVMEAWVKYLMENGTDPGDQLCTDDFAGHLNHNTNLAVKAILGVEAYGILHRELGNQEEYEKYHEIAKKMASDWEENAADGDHTRLTFDKAGTWSLKYNLVWDLLFDSQLFSKELFEKETDYYIKMQNEYGTPLDSRCEYTKSDWILWTTAMTENPEKQKALLAPVAKYLHETESRVPFSDWYDTENGLYCYFLGRSVQGGIFMPLLCKLGLERK